MTAFGNLVIFMGLFSLLFGGCGKQPTTPLTQIQSQGKALPSLDKPPEVTSELEEGFHDLVFFVQDFQKLSDGRRTIHVAGIYKGKQLGLDVLLSPNWKSGSLGKDVPLVVYQGKVTFHSIGPESDTFLQVVDELYGTKLNPKAMRTDTVFAGLSLEGDPNDLAKGAVKIKLFYESDKEDEYAELFTNIELAGQRLEIAEKDESYRLPIVKALQTP